MFTDFSKSFTLPASKTNNKIFKHYYNFDIDGGFDARKKVSAKIELNDLPFRDGKIIHGTWQQIVFVELDTRPRNRRISVQIVGE